MDKKIGLVDQVKLESKFLTREVTISIYLPKEYTDLYKHHVVIAFDGRDFFQFGQIHRAYEKLRSTEQLERAIIVGVHYEDVEGRRTEFHPDGSRRKEMSQFVVKELIPYIDGNYSTLKVGNARILAGDSLAASISLLTGLKYPHHFSQLALFSPMINDTVIEAFEDCTSKELLNIKHYIGKEEDHFKLISGDMADFLTPNREFSEILKSSDVTYDFEELDGGHTWKTWKPKLEDMLRYFLSQQNQKNLI
ncbi:alpha/beta hydrolase [Mammaliicoccus stepanovicii]|uniref:Putative esterase n=1 Tax=Mammaliicoccus stepanovicii TaxID=643214 RepID=A0A239ZSH0_9STAP|nr:alpha/beta hydrolase-fold protein [Mammaliicoccus stepanovicii]PNZ77096.1 acetylesterase [Mammaliicoccus stepanovicii]GGI38805.1 acetylesterase [Mammaliicoccus stepanovicii]SNV73889.1 putative esterase [Mammaliicoccus stepanovicii]